MYRIMRAGRYYYEVSYHQDENAPPVIHEIHALSNLILFLHDDPFLFESSDRIKISDAAKLTVNMYGKITLLNLLEELLLHPKPKSVPWLAVVS